MKLIAITLARTVLLFDLTQFTKGLNLWPVCERLVEKYKFAKSPKNALDLDEQKALAFKVGSFLNSRKQNVTVSLSIYSNGISVDAQTSTKDTDELVDEVLAMVSSDFSLSLPPGSKRVYVSQAELEMDLSVGKLNPQLPKLIAEISRRTQSINDRPKSYDFGVLQFWAEDVNPATSPAYFRLERKVGSPFSSNRYFTQSALTTSDHIELITELAGILEN